jgi:hypothetical protein
LPFHLLGYSFQNMAFSYISFNMAWGSICLWKWIHMITFILSLVMFQGTLLFCWFSSSFQKKSMLQANGRLHLVCFWYADKFLVVNNVVLLFHLNDLHDLKEVKSYPKSYIGYEIHMKWVMANSLPLTSSEDPILKVWHQSIIFHFHSFPFSFSFHYFPSNSVKFCKCFWARLFFLWGQIHLWAPPFDSPLFSNSLSRKGINVHFLEEDLLMFNCTNMFLMPISKIGRPLRVAKEVHVMIQDFIEFCSKSGSFICQFIYIHRFSCPFATSFDSIISKGLLHYHDSSKGIMS